MSIIPWGYDNRALFMVISWYYFLPGCLSFLTVYIGEAKLQMLIFVHQGGGMDTAQFTVVFQEHKNNYRGDGKILSVISGLGLVKTIEQR